MLAFLAASCARAPVERVAWPSGLPPIDHYESVYAEDESNQAVQSRDDYLRWVVRFYKGWRLYQDGWESTTRDVLYGVESKTERKRMKRKMATLGRLISSEWAKNSDNRRIRSRELSIWGQALLKSMNRGAEEELIDQVTRDVNALLSERLEPSDINLERYTEPGSSAGVAPVDEQPGPEPAVGTGHPA